MLIAGSLLSWVTVSANWANWVTAWSGDPSAIPSSAIPAPPPEWAEFTQALSSMPGVQTGHWKVALVCGIVAVICAAIRIAFASARVVEAAVLLLAGLAGSGIALYAATIDRTHAVAEVASKFVGPGDVRKGFIGSIGTGIWLCLIGGLVAIVAGIMELRSGPAAQSATSR